MECPFCFADQCQSIEIPYTRFQHLGFENYYQNGKILRCSKCQLLSNILDAEKQSELNNIYESLEYSEGKITNQTYLTSEGNRVTRSHLQAEILSTYLESLPPPSVILDIGCFDGALLRELYKHYPQAQLHGFDVNRHVQSVFPQEKNFHFWRSELENITLNCDLICLSFSIFYIRDIAQLFSYFPKWLKPGGVIFIQTPNVITNPYSILLGDQYYYFTPTIFRNMFHRIGYEVQFIENPYFPRDLLVIAKQFNEIPQWQYEDDQSIYQCLEHLNQVKQKINTLSQQHRIGVLGTTMTAAFVDSVLGDKNVFFVDENTSRIGSQFRGKRVLHPSSLDPDVSLILPYGASNQKIKSRFTEEYQLTQFELV